jgi:hypothetical protein
MAGDYLPAHAMQETAATTGVAAVRLKTYCTVTVTVGLGPVVPQELLTL